MDDQAQVTLWSYVPTPRQIKAASGLGQPRSWYTDGHRDYFVTVNEQKFFWEDRRWWPWFTRPISADSPPPKRPKPR